MNAKEASMSIVQNGARPRTILTGIALGESPRWHDGRLWFSDWGQGHVVAVDGDGLSEIIAPVHSPIFCFDFLPDGHALIVSPGERRLIRREVDGSLVTHAALEGFGKMWNDIVVDGRGNAYVNDVGFDLIAQEPVAAGGVALVTPEGTVRRAAEGLAFPNGMAVTPDGSTLIVAESYGKKLTAFGIAPDGALSKGRTWASLGDGVPDGICVDVEGAVWYARCSEPALRPRPRGGRRPADGTSRSRRLRVRARRCGSQDPVHRRCRMARPRAHGRGGARANGPRARARRRRRGRRLAMRLSRPARTGLAQSCRRQFSAWSRANSANDVGRSSRSR
jgi:sugar lactone lactonase YvrE